MSSQDKKIKILFAISNFIIGGAEKQVIQQINNFDREIFDIYVATLLPKPEHILADRIHLPPEKIFSFEFSSFYDWRHWLHLLRFLRRQRFDIVYSHLFFANLAARIAAILSRTPVIVSVEHNIYQDKKRLYIWADRMLAKFTDKIIAVSEGVKIFTAKQEHIRPEKFMVVYNGIETPAINVSRSSKRRELGLKDNEVAIVSIGRIVRQKGFVYLIRSAKKVLSTFPAAKFLIVGPSQEADTLDEIKHEIGDEYKDRIILLGPRRDVFEILLACDIFVLPSLWEGFSVTALEAMAVGLPAVASDIDVIRELIKDGQNGILVPPKDDAALSDAILKLIRNADLREKLKSESLKTAEKFTAVNNAGQLENIFINLYNGKMGKPVIVKKESIEFKSDVEEYLLKKYPQITKKERDKIFKDWLYKIEKSESLARELIKKFNLLENGKKILDVEFGPSGISIALAMAGVKVWGLEIEPELLEIAEKEARRRNVNPDFRLYNGLAFPFGGDEFDLCVCVSVLEHADNPSKLLSEIFRVLKPGGALYLSFPNRFYPIETHTRLFGITYLPYKLAAWITEKLGHVPFKDFNLRLYHYWNLKNFLKENNLKFRLMYFENPESAAWKKLIKKILYKLNIHQSAFLPVISVYFQKQPLLQEGAKITKEEIAKGYDEIAGKIDLDEDFYKKCAAVQKTYHGKILDIGCGQGFLLKKISEKAEPDSKIFGLDISPKLCEIARRNNPKAAIIQGDAENLPFEDRQFDFVFMTETLEHLLDYNRALSEACRVLKPEGIFVVTVPNRDWTSFDFYEPTRKKFQPVDDHYFRFEEIKTLLENNSFKILKYRGLENLFYYGKIHKLEEIAAFFLPFLNKKMKRLLFKCVKK